MKKLLSNSLIVLFSVLVVSCQHVVIWTPSQVLIGFILLAIALFILWSWLKYKWNKFFNKK